MICKYCNAQVGDEFTFCPYCGKNLTQEEVLPLEQQEEIIEETPAEEIDTEEVAAEEEVAKEAAPVKKAKVWQLILAIAGGVVALGALALLLLYAFGVKLVPDNDIFYKDNYVSSNVKMDKVIAKVGDRELTNELFQVYYHTTVHNFVQYYGSYLEAIGLDPDGDLSQQKCYLDETLTWQQYFIKESLNEWHRYQVLRMVADDAGYVLEGDWKTAMDDMPEDLEESAAKGEFESVQAMITDKYGEYCTAEAYLKYLEYGYYGTAYTYSIYEVTDADAEAYFAENEATFTENEVTKDSGMAGTVRHILIQPEGGVTDETTQQTTYTEDQWQAAYQEAEKVLNEWKDGEATEESFVALVAKHSKDEGSVSNGGLYENVVADGTYVEEFEAWAVDAARQAGDVEIVKTVHGYHIMYYVSGQAEWIYYAKTNLVNDRYNAMEEAIAEKTEQMPLKVNYKKIAIG